MSRVTWATVIVLAVLVRVGAGAPVPPSSTTAAVRKQLAARHPHKLPLKEGELAIPANMKLKEFAAPAALRDRMPGMRFYRTTLDTGYVMCYPEVETLVLARTAGGRVTIYECLSPTYANPSKEFLAQFRGLVGATAKERAELADAVAQLFVPITYKGRIVDAKLAGGRFTATLMHAQLRWREVVITFDKAGRIEAVELRHHPEGTRD